jgi:hypothetical protein
MKFTVQVDSNFDIDIDAFVEIMNAQVLTERDFIMGMSSSRAVYGNEVVELKVLDNKL